jgi:hypothetical protein
VIHRESISDILLVLRKSVISSVVIMFIIANAGLFAFITRAIPGRHWSVARCGAGVARPFLLGSTRRCS